MTLPYGLSQFKHTTSIAQTVRPIFEEKVAYSIDDSSLYLMLEARLSKINTLQD